MKSWGVSRKGKRELRTRGKVKLLPLFLVAAMLSGMLLTSSVGAVGNPTDSYDQVVNRGSTSYYDENGLPVTGSEGDGAAVSVTKTIAQRLDTNNQPLENQFRVNLEVTTHTDYKTVTVSEDSAVVLVVDLSGSMASECAECGEIQSASHSGHTYKSRIDVADGVLKEFLKAYKASANGAKRYLSIVGFASEPINPQAQNWMDIALSTDAQLVGLVDKMVGWVKDARPPMGTDTQTTIAMQYANSRLDDGDIRGVNRRSVILMTDGMPAAANGELGNPIKTADVPLTFQGHYEGLKTFVANEAKKFPNDLSGMMFSVLPEAFLNPGAFGFMMRDKGAPLYSVSFISGVINYIQPQTMRNWMELFSDATYDASDADKLETAFTEIIERLTTTEPDTVSDILHSWWKVDASALEASGAAVKDGRIVWEIAGQDPVSVSPDGRSRTYQLTYDATLDNLGKDYPGSGIVLPVSDGEPTFTYYLYENGKPKGPLRTVKLPVPTVKSSAGELSFTKVDPQMAAIPKSGVEEGGKFELTTADDPSFKRTAATNKDGVVAFANIPSGHTYVLTETKAPLEFVLGSKTTWDLKVKWAETTSSDIPTDSTAGLYIKNDYDPAEKAFAVQKVWEDGTGYYKKPGTTVEFEVKSALPDGSAAKTKTGSMSYDDRHQDNDKIWETTISLPTKDTATGKELTYTLTETNAGLGWTVTTSTESTPFLIRNILPNTIDITVNKVWEDAEGFSGEHPEVEIYLYRDNTDNAVKTATLTASETSVIFADMPLQDDLGNPITYRVGEQAVVAGYRWTGNTGDQHNGFTLTNSSLELEKTSYTVHKHWYDDSDALETRPDSVVVQLQQSIDGGANWDDVIGKTLTLSNTARLESRANVWAGEFTDLPQYTDDADKKEITYHAREVAEVEGYHTSYSGIDINNTYNVTSVTAHKIWEKPTSVATPDVTFELLQNGAVIRAGVLKAPADEYTFSGLPKLDGSGAAYTYSVRETVPDGYKQTASVNTTFTNTIDQCYDVTVKGQIRWELRNEPESVLPAEVLVQLYAGGKPCTYPNPFPQNPDLAGQPVTRVAKAGEGWTYEFKQAQRYTNDKLGVIDYSVRELSYNGTPAADKSTIQFINASEPDPRNFGAHYDAVDKSVDGLFVCNIRNHTDAEATDYSYRIDRIYTRYLDGSLVSTTPVTGVVVAQAAPFSLTFNTADYAKNPSNTTYSFARGSVTGGLAKTTTMSAVTEGENTVQIAQNDGIYIVALEYELRETTPYYPPDPPKPPKPTEPTDPTTPPTDPTVPPTDPTTPPTDPTVPPTDPTTPPTDPTVPPTDPTTPPTDPTTPPTPPKDPDIRPNPPVLTPEEEEKVDEVIKDVTEHPEHIIKDKDSFEEMFPEVSIEDLPPPLYWGPEFAIVDVPVYEEIVAIDSGLVPLGSLPQTGSDLHVAATRTALAGMAAMVVAGSAALGGWLLLRRKYEED